MILVTEDIDFSSKAAASCEVEHDGKKLCFLPRAETIDERKSSKVRAKHGPTETIDERSRARRQKALLFA